MGRFTVNPRLKSLLERLKREDGFTLAELLSAQIIGTIVIGAAVMMVIIAFNSASRITDRVNSAAQGRIAMEEIQQRLRSQTCLFPVEYAVYPATNSTSASNSFVYASPVKMAFFTDLGATNGGTAATSAVGLSPQLRILSYDPGPTSGKDAYRRGLLIDATKAPINASIPFRFNFGSGLSTLSVLSTGIAGVTNSTTRAVAEGVTSLVSGATTQPIFRFYDDSGAEITASTSTPVPYANLGNIASVEVNFRVLGTSGKDGNVTGTSDDRTASFSNEIHLKTPQSICQ